MDRRMICIGGICPLREGTWTLKRRKTVVNCQLLTCRQNIHAPLQGTTVATSPFSMKFLNWLALRTNAPASHSETSRRGHERHGVLPLTLLSAWLTSGAEDPFSESSVFLPPEGANQSDVWAIDCGCSTDNTLFGYQGAGTARDAA